MRDRGRLARVIVADANQHATVLRCALAVAMLERVAAAIDARTLCVPKREDTVARRSRKQRRLLGAPHCGCSEVLIDAGLEQNVCCGQSRRLGPQLHVDAAQGRATIAGNVASGIQFRGPVESPLQQCDANQRLRSGDQYTARIDVVFVVQRNRPMDALGGVQAHPASSVANLRSTTLSTLPIGSSGSSARISKHLGTL